MDLRLGSGAWGAMRADHDRQWCVSPCVSTWPWPRERTEQNETVDGIRSRNETAFNETGELRHRGWKDHDGLPSVGRETANLVVGIHDGFRMRCAFHEESLLDIQRRRGKKLTWSAAAECSSQQQRLSKRHWQGNTLREHAAFGTPGPTAGVTLDGDGEPTVRIRVPTGPATPSAEERALHEASGHVPYRSWCQWCIAVHHQVRYFCNCCNILNLLFTFLLFLILFFFYFLLFQFVTFFYFFSLFFWIFFLGGGGFCL